MKYKEIQSVYTDVRIPDAWNKAVKAEKTAEILVYNMLVQCMNNFVDVSLELSADNPVNAVLRSWTRDEDVGFGTNAISLTPKEDGGLILGCCYDIWKLRDDIEIMANNMFGTIDLDKVGDKVMNADIEIADDEIDALFAGVQKKKVPIVEKK